jgi:serine/threonine protein phosphatase PrpC
VLTLALVEGARVTIGHVGDSRLYLLNGSGIRRLTSDHSPVGEMEDSGEISEEEAMSHPRRNEVYRDVGTCPPGEWLADFAEVLQYEFPPTAALLLCSDGLSGHLTSREICEVAGRCGGDAEESARRLVRAANAAGGTDNITVVFVAGPEFRPAQPATRPRHRTTRLRLRRGFWTGRAAFLSYGLLLGMVLWAVLRIRG